MAIEQLSSNANGSIRFDGAAELIMDLKKYEQTDLKNTLIKEFGKIAQPIVKDVEFFLPSTENQLSNWGGKNSGPGTNAGVERSSGGFPIYNASRAKSGIKVKKGLPGRRPRKNFYSNLLSIWQTDGAATVFEWAGTKSNNTFTKNLTAKFDRPMRALFKAVDKNLPEVEKATINAIMETEKEWNTRQAKNRGN